MLTWTKDSEGWHADGYVIHLLEPFRWALLQDSEQIEMSVVSTITEPLAVTRTLTECKREAELLELAQRRSILFRRLTAQLLLAVCGLVFTLGSPPPWSLLLSIALFYVVVRSASYMLGLLTSRSGALFGEAFYQ